MSQTLLRIWKDRFFRFLLAFFAVVAVLPLLFIIYYIFSKGIGVINWEFLVSLPESAGSKGGGVSNALVGTLMVVLEATVIAVPIALLSGIFLAESRGSVLSYWVRLSIEILQGTPSIVIGIVAYLWVVKPMGSFSAFSGGIALAIMMIPFLARSTEETLRLIPNSYREASLSLGVPYYKTILRIILPSGASGILTGFMISLSRIAGETAPLLFTAFGSPFLNTNPKEPVSALPLMIFKFATSPYPTWQEMAWGASLLLILMILILNISAKLIIKRWEIPY
jgi:phosphate transport system permease protein